MSNKVSSENEKRFAEYIKRKRVLIADANKSSRTGLFKLLIDMGAKATQIVVAQSYAEAEGEIERQKPEIVICDFDLGKGRGLDLLQRQRAQLPDAKKMLFVIVTGNTSQSAVALAAEEDVDSYVLKPYNVMKLRHAIISAALAKDQPSPYYKTLDSGKELLKDGKFDDAMAKFKEAEGQDPKPSLALFYQGQTQFMKEMFDPATGSYQQGLSFNKIHYKCMVGLFDLFMKQKKHGDAYDLVKRISRYFPGNPNRLTSVLRLAITTQNFDDIERFYQSFQELDQRNEELIRYVCAALVVTGKFYLQRNFVSRGLELLQKAAATSGGRPKVIRDIVNTLCECGNFNEAKNYLAKFPAETHKSEDYVVSEYMVQTHFQGAGYGIKRGRELLNEGHHHPTVYRILIERSLEGGFKDSVENLLAEAKNRWPDFEKQLEAHRRRSGRKSAA